MEPATILMIGDEKAFRDSLSADLEGCGYRVLVAAHGRVDPAFLTEAHPNLMLVDLCVPEIDGLEVLTQLTQMAPDIPLIVVSETDHINEAVRRGAWDYILKPVDDLALLEHRIEAVLERARLRQENRAYQQNLEEQVGEQTAILRAQTDILQESMTRFQWAMEASQDGVWDWDIPSDQVYYSPGYFAMLGYTSGQFPSHTGTWLELLHPDDRAAALAANTACVENQCNHFQVEFRMLAQDGSWRWILGRGKAVLRDAQGRALRMVGTHTDITARKQGEEELRHLRNYLANIIDSMPSVLIGVDVEGRVTQWNQQAVQQTGLTAAAAVGRPLAEAFPRLTAEWTHIQTTIRERAAWQERSRTHRLPDGSVGYEDLTVYPLVANGVEGVVIRLDDVTERVRLEEMMLQSEKMLSVGGLAAGMAHEINNPLSGILQNTQMVLLRLTGDLPANQKAAQTAGLSWPALQSYLAARRLPDMLEDIRAAGRRAAAIVQNMLSFARKSEAVISSHNLAELLDQTLELAQTDYNLKKSYDFRQIEIVREYAPDLPLVPCEGGQMQQVFLNILKNGAEAMTEYKAGATPGWQPRFRLRAWQEGAQVWVEIADNGGGIPEAVRRRVFEPFFTTKPVGQGTGLGLSVSYFIVVEKHHGQLTVASEPGQGAAFRIALPLTRDVPF